jgi:hypothetical protein
MDNINFSKVDNLTYVDRIVQISTFDYILYIDLNKTSDNIKKLIIKYQPEFSNIIKININNTNKYKIIDSNNNFKISMFKDIQLYNKLIKIELVFAEKYLNFYIKDMIVYDKKEENKNYNKNNKFNTNKNVIIRKIVKI